MAPIVITCGSAPEERRAALADAGADVVIAGESTVDLALGFAALAERELLRVCCEGGPHLFGELVADGLVDQLCLTVAPVLVGGDPIRIALGPHPVDPLPLTLASIITADDGFLLLRYRR